MEYSAKRTFLRFSRSLPVLLLLIGCSGDEASESERGIRAVLDAQVAAWNEGDVERYMEGYWRSDKTIFVSGGSRLMGYDSVLARYRRSYPTQEAMGNLTFEELEVIMLSPSASIARGIWRLERDQDEPWGRFTLLLEQKPEGWRIVYDHTSSAE